MERLYFKKFSVKYYETVVQKILILLIMCHNTFAKIIEIEF